MHSSGIAYLYHELVTLLNAIYLLVTGTKRNTWYRKTEGILCTVATITIWDLIDHSAIKHKVQIPVTFYGNGRPFVSE